MLTNKLLSAAAGLALAGAMASPAGAKPDRAQPGRAAAPQGAIDHVIVIDLENENYADTFGAGSPATYLNGTLAKRGQLLPNYFATSHVSLGNYIAQVSGQAPTPTVNNDCISLASLPKLFGGFYDVTPGTDAPDAEKYPGQVIGDGCVYPAPTATSHGAQTIGDQLDAARGAQRGHGDDDRALNWREYAEDMGKDPARDGGTTCAHPALGGVDLSNSAAANDQYATRHNPFVYFHSVIDDQDRCDSHVVPLGSVSVGTGGARDAFQGALAQDLRREETTPRFAFVSPNLCNDGHDAKCVGPNVEGGSAGGLVAADLWLKHWMPLILGSEAYRNGKTLVVVTFDEANPVGANGDSRACCGESAGPNLSNSGYSPLLGILHYQQTPAPGESLYPGGGQVGAVLLNPRLIQPGTVNDTPYNHYSALRSYEDLLGLTRGGDDGRGHLGFAAAKDLVPFGADVFNRVAGRGNDR